jgi:hypothetical protein
VLPDVHLYTGDTEDAAQTAIDIYCPPIQEAHFVSGFMLLSVTNDSYHTKFRWLGVFFFYGEGGILALQKSCRAFDENHASSELEYTDDGKGGYKYTATIILKGCRSVDDLNLAGSIQLNYLAIHCVLQSS